MLTTNFSGARANEGGEGGGGGGRGGGGGGGEQRHLWLPLRLRLHRHDVRELSLHIKDCSLQLPFTFRYNHSQVAAKLSINETQYAWIQKYPVGQIQEATMHGKDRKIDTQLMESIGFQECQTRNMKYPT